MGYSICDKNNIQCVLSSKKNKTGTDRIYEFSKKTKSQVYINVQGDEPIINPSNIKKIINYSLKNPEEKNSSGFFNWCVFWTNNQPFFFATFFIFFFFVESSFGLSSLSLAALPLRSLK